MASYKCDSRRMRDNEAVSSIVPESVPLIVELGFKVRVKSFNNLVISIMFSKFSKKMSM